MALAKAGEPFVTLALSLSRGAEEVLSELKMLFDK
jgi:hypothetical protein